jgi:hypothetical protein
MTEALTAALPRVGVRQTAGRLEELLDQVEKASSSSSEAGRIEMVTRRI